MTIGVSILLLVAGAILKYAVADEVSGVDLSVIGIILMIAGAVGLVISLFLESQRRRTGTVVERQVVDDRYPPV